MAASRSSGWLACRDCSHSAITQSGSHRSRPRLVVPCYQQVLGIWLISRAWMVRALLSSLRGAITLACSAFNAVCECSVMRPFVLFDAFVPLFLLLFWKKCLYNFINSTETSLDISMDCYYFFYSTGFFPTRCASDDWWQGRDKLHHACIYIKPPSFFSSSFSREKKMNRKKKLKQVPTIPFSCTLLRRRAMFTEIRRARSTWSFQVFMDMAHEKEQQHVVDDDMSIR